MKNSRFPGSYRYQRDVAEDVSFATITHQTEVLMVINTRNFHEISIYVDRRFAIPEFPRATTP